MAVNIPYIAPPNLGGTDYSGQLYQAASGLGETLAGQRKLQFLKEKDQRDYALELQKLKAGIGTNAEKWYGGPQWYDMGGGNMGFGVLSDWGNFKEMPAPEGATWAPPVTNLNTGTSYIPVNTRGGGRADVPEIPINVTQTHAAQELGTQSGKTAAALPQIESDANITVQSINDLLANPYLEKITGDVGGTLPAGASIWSSVREGSRKAQADLDQIINRTWLTAYNQLRGAQAITDVEGLKAENAMSTLHAQNVSDEDYRQALIDLREVVMEGVRVAKEKARMANQVTAPATDIPAPTDNVITEGRTLPGSGITIRPTGR